MFPKATKAAIVLSTFALAVLLLWINRFEYQHTGTTQVLVRINRFTGRGCYFLTDGTWKSQLIPPAKDGESKDAELLFGKKDSPCE